MPGLLDPKRKKKIRFKRQDGVALMPDLITAFDQLADMLGVEIEIEGVERSRVIGGGAKLIKLPTGGSTEVIAVSTPVWGIRSDSKIAPGTIGGRTPTYGGTPISPIGSAPTVPMTGSVRLFFKITFSITKDSAGFLASQNVSTVEIVTSNGGDSESIKYIQFQESVSGVWSQPMLTGSQGASLCNTGPNATNLVLTRL